MVSFDIFSKVLITTLAVTTVNGAIYDYRLTPMYKLMLPKESRPVLPECDPVLPNLSVGDMLIESFEDFYRLKEQTPLFILGVSNSSDSGTCYSEDMIQALWRDFDRGKWQLEVMICRVNDF
jgi:hypothetical protein